MRQHGRGSVAASVARQAAATTLPQATNVVVLADARPAATRLEEGVNIATGKRCLRAVYPGKEPGTTESTELSFLLEFPGLSKDLSSAFLHCGLSMTHHSRKQMAQNLSGGLCAFLREQGTTDITLDRLTKPRFLAFIAWLDAPRENGQPWAHQTRGSKLSPIRTLLDALSEISGQPAPAMIARHNIPSNPWPGASKKIIPRKRLSREHLSAIIAACEGEVRDMRRRFVEGRKLIAAGLVELGKGNQNYKDPAVCLAKLSLDHPTVIPFLKTIRSSDPRLASLIKETMGVEYYDRYLYASSRDLVPLAILIAVSTAFNADTILLLEWSGIEEIKRLVPRIISPRSTV